MNQNNGARLHNWLVDMLKTLLRSGRSLDDACQQLSQMHNSAAIRAARHAVEEELGWIRTLREPPSLERGPYESWYLGPTPNDRYWPPLKNLLGKKEWPEDVIQSLDDASTKVVSLMKHPGVGAFQTRGLVLGYIQSGKTANFTAVIAKAADAGYRFFIVLSGLTNSLRRQTQIRLNQELVELNTESWITLTDEGRDFGAFAVTNVNAFLTEHASQKTLCVIKKNAARLRRLHTWLSGAHQNVLRTCAVIMIDDEADLASINTAAWNEERTRINNLILSILALLPKVTYIGYTATPFANVLIDPSVPEDLYPRDFIIDLPRPSSYFGPESIFGRERVWLDDTDEGLDGLDMVRTVPEEEVPFLRPSGNYSMFRPEMTPNLRQAILYFWLSTAARRVREAQQKHSTMLIHTTSLAVPQTQFRQPIELFRSQVHQLITQNNAELLEEMRGIWDEERARVPQQTESETTVLFGDLQPYLGDIIANTNVVIENYLTAPDQRLIYGDEPGVFIVVGGNILGRGLTLEGLIVSFFMRTASAYDTLLQMGRWFGFRLGYSDLPRIWMTNELRGYLYDLATVEQEIRNDIRQYQLENLTPLEFGVRIRTHPALSITSRLKMQHAVPCGISFSGSRIQTFLFRHRDLNWLSDNLTAARNLIKAATDSGISPVSAGENRWVLRDVDAELILEFLRNYHIHENQEHMRSDLVQGYITDQNQAGKLLYWNLVVMSQRTDILGTIALGFGDIPLINRSKLKSPFDYADIKAVMSKADIVADLDTTRIEIVNKDAGALLAERNRDEHGVKDKGLILIYPISRDSEPDPHSRQHREPLNAAEHIVGLALVFPKAAELTPQGYMTVDLSGVSREEYEPLPEEDEAE